MKLKKLILHIGANHTRSSDIQTFLFENSNLLNKQGFFVPEIETFTNPIKNSIINKKAYKTRALLDKIVNEAHSNECDTIIISDEVYSKETEHNLANVSLFSDYFDEVEIVMFCDRPDRHSEIDFVKAVMGKEMKYWHRPEQWYMNNSGKNYYETAYFYDTTIHNAKITLIGYDLNSHRIIDSFIEVCGMASCRYRFPNNDEVENHYNKYMVEVMNHVNTYIHDDQTFEAVKSFVLKHNKLQEGPKPIFFTYEWRLENQYILEGDMKKLIDQYNHGHSLFDELEPIEVSPSLEEETKSRIVSDIIQKFHLTRKRSDLGFTHFKNALGIGSFKSLPDVYCEVALFCHSFSFNRIGLKFVEIAKEESDITHRQLKRCETIEGILKKEPFIDYDMYSLIGHIDDAFRKGRRKELHTLAYKIKLSMAIATKSEDIYREMGILCEWYGDISAAYFFMMLARSINATCSFIERKTNKYRFILDGRYTGKKTKVIVHMGINKTATTSLQCTLSSNRDLLKDNGYFFNRSWRINCSRVFKYLCVEHFEEARAHIKEGKVSEFYDSSHLDSLISELKEFEGNGHIFSGEDLHSLHFYSMFRLRELLLLLFPHADIQIIFTVRDYISFIHSNVQQSAKNGRSETYIIFRRLVKSNYFRKGILKMEKVFGKDNVLVYPFEASLNHPFGPVGYFFELCNFNDDFIKALDIKRKNESLTQNAATLLFWINKKLFDIYNRSEFNPKKIKRFIHPLLNFSDKTKYKVKNKYIRLLIPGMKREAKWLKAHRGIEYKDFSVIHKEKSLALDQVFEEDIKTSYHELNPMIKHIVYLCFVEHSKDLRLDKKSRKTLKNLVIWCQNNYPKYTDKDYLLKNPSDTFVSGRF